MAAITKPKLPQLKTPMTSTFPSSTFPSELSALSARTPLSAFPDFIIKQEDGIKTPITPPVAYTDFLKSMASPITADKSSGSSSPSSAPSSEASNEHSNCSCSCETHKSPISTVLPSPFAHPSSAPSTGRFGRLRIPISPAVSNIDSPLSATSSTVRSPFSARSPYDWDGSSKARYFDFKSPNSSRIRHVREIVTRTVTYTPRMSPAPKGKRRKLE